MKLNLKDILTYAGIAVAAIGGYIIAQKLGIINSYVGLSAAQVMKVYKEFDKNYPVLSRAISGDENHYLIRGIYAGGIPLYYHYEFWPKTNEALYSVYPLLWNEEWSTGRDWFGRTGKLIYPNGS